MKFLVYFKYIYNIQTNAHMLNYSYFDTDSVPIYRDDNCLITDGELNRNLICDSVKMQLKNKDIQFAPADLTLYMSLIDQLCAISDYYTKLSTYYIPVNGILYKNLDLDDSDSIKSWLFDYYEYDMQLDSYAQGIGAHVKTSKERFVDMPYREPTADEIERAMEAIKNCGGNTLC